MTKFFWNALKLSPVFLGSMLLLANSTLASEAPAAKIAPNSSTAATSQSTSAAQTLAQVTSVSQLASPEPNALAQVTSVSQLSDVQPTDWAFQALQSLVERYGCIAGYPDGTYRGNRALTRYEFAAGLNACLDRVNELIATATADRVTREDLATLQRLQEEFSAELATLRGRVDGLEARTAELEANQFSTTTKLAGEAIFNVGGVVGDDRAVISAEGNTPGRNSGDAGEIDDNVVFSQRTRIALNTSFSGKDLLRTRLQARNVSPFGTAITGTNMTRLGFDGDEGNQVNVDQAFYRFPLLSDKVVVQLDAANTEWNERGFATYSPFESSGRGSISRYGRFSPIYRQGISGQAPGISVSINPQGILGLNLGYVAGTGNDPGRAAGLIDGSYAALGQINFRPSEALNVGLTYAHTYDTPRRFGTAAPLRNTSNLFGSTGSILANSPFGNVPTTGNHYGVEASFRLSPKLIVFGWGGYTQAIAERSPRFSNAVNGTALTGPTGAKADAWYYAGGLALPDFIKEGGLLGLIFGQAPKLTANEDVREVAFGNRQRRDTGTSYHAEGFYRFPVTDNIDITPGVLVILNPEHNDDNDTEYVGTLRTTFRF